MEDIEIVIPILEVQIEPEPPMVWDVGVPDYESPIFTVTDTSTFW